MKQNILDRPTPPANHGIVYGQHPQQFGHLRLPSGAGPFPVAIGIHGGYWRVRYGLDYFGHVCAALTARGIATWNIEYRRLSDGADEIGGWPRTLLDVAAAADALRTLAPSYRLDLSRVVAVGHSAGGQLAAWLAGRGNIAGDSPLRQDDPLPLRGVVALAGVLDLKQAWQMNLSDGVVERFLDGTPWEVPERYAAASPAELLPLGVRQVVIHGTADDSVPFQISEGYVERARACGDEVAFLALDGAGHFEIVDPTSAEWPVVERAVLDLLEM